MEEPSPRLLASLVRAVAILALPAPDQLCWLESLGDAPSVDELALSLDVRLAPQFVAVNWLPAAVLEPLLTLNALLDSMSGSQNEHLWNVAAVESAPRWSEVRAQAKAVLHLIN